MSVSHVVKSLLKAQSMSLVLVTSGLLLTGCGAGSADTAVQTETTAPSNPDSGTGNNPGNTPDTGGNDGGNQPAPHSLALTSQPSAATIYEGQSQTFTLAVSHNYPITIRWTRNGSVISGATGTSYTVSNATTSSAGTYSCSVTDGELTVNCNSFALTVNRIVRITTQPSNQAVSEGVNVQLSVAASGTGPLSYQWYFNGQSLSGASSATLSLNNIAVNKAGSYYAVVTNAGSNATSNTVSVSVTPAIVANGRAQITWNRPTTRADGSSLPAGEISGYKLYHAQSVNGALSPLIDLTSNELSVVVDELTAGTHYFAMSTRDTGGLESSLSARFSVTIQ